MSKSKEKAVSFEESIAQLEGIIERIESGEIGLEESLTQYERGVQLAQHCRTILAQVEKKITELSVDQQGRLRGEAGEMSNVQGPKSDVQSPMSNVQGPRSDVLGEIPGGGWDDEEPEYEAKPE